MLDRGPVHRLEAGQESVRAKLWRQHSTPKRHSASWGVSGGFLSGSVVQKQNRGCQEQVRSQPELMLPSICFLVLFML